MNSKDKLSKIGYKIGEKMDSLAEKVNESGIKDNALNYGKKVLDKASKLIEDKKKEERCCASCGKKITSWRTRKIKDGELCRECSTKYRELAKEKKILIENFTLSELNKKNNEYKVEKKRKQTFALIALVVFLIADIAFLKSTIKEEDHEGELQIPEVSSIYYGNDVGRVAEELKAYGFTNVQTIALEDLEESESEKENTVDSITIEGSHDLKTDDWVETDVEVCVYYHSLKQIEEITSTVNEAVNNDVISETIDLDKFNTIGESGESSDETVLEEYVNPYIKLTKFNVNTITEYSHISGGITLGNNEGVLVQCTLSPASATEDDIIIVYDEEMFNCELNRTYSTSNAEITYEYRITGKKEGSDHVYIVSSYEYIEKYDDQENLEAFDLYIHKLNSADGKVVYVTSNGEKYHYSEACAGEYAIKTTLRDAEACEYEKCKKCGS